MSVIGVSPTDLVTLARGVKSLYDSYKRAPSDFDDLIEQLRVFHALINSVINTINCPDISNSADITDSYKQECISVIQGCKSTVDELEKMKAKYSWKDKEGRRHWKRLRAGTKGQEIDALQRRLWNHMQFVQGAENRLNQRRNGNKLLTLCNEQEEQNAIMRRQEQMLIALGKEQRELRRQLATSSQAKVDLANEDRGLGNAMMAVSGTYHDMASKDRAREKEDDSEAEMYAQWEELRCELRRMGFDFSVLQLYQEEIFVFFEGLYNKSLRQACATEQPVREPVYPKIHKDDIETNTLKHYGVDWERDPSDRDYLVLLEELDEAQIDMLFDHTEKLRKDNSRRAKGPSPMVEAPEPPPTAGTTEWRPKAGGSARRPKAKGVTDKAANAVFRGVFGVSL